MTRARGRTCQISGDRTNPPLTRASASKRVGLRMGRMTRQLLAGLLASLVVATPALANTEVSYTARTIEHGSQLSIKGDALADKITLTQSSLSYTVTRDGGLVIAQFNNECVP